MEIVNEVKSLLLEIEGLTVMYDSGFSANIRLDRKTGPFCLLYALTDYNIDISKGLKHQTADLQFFVFDRTKLDVSAEDKDVLMSSMESYSEQIIRLINNDKRLVIEDTNIRLQTSYGKFDSFCVGVSFTLKLSLKKGSCL